MRRAERELDQWNPLGSDELSKALDVRVITQAELEVQLLGWGRGRLTYSYGEDE